jgi:hypothetical protein
MCSGQRKLKKLQKCSFSSVNPSNSRKKLQLCSFFLIITLILRISHQKDAYLQQFCSGGLFYFKKDVFLQFCREQGAGLGLFGLID